MRKIIIFLLLDLLMLAAAASAQDVSVRYQGQLIGSRGLPLANQNVAVCTQPAVTTTQPCSPLATLATSTSTSSGGANPLTSDTNGNFFFYAAPGKYTVQAYGPQVSGQFVQPDTVLSCSPSGNCTQTGTQTLQLPPIATGTQPGTSGTGACSATAQKVGGSWAGSIQCTGTTGASTITFTFTITAPNGWSCKADDISTPANKITQTGFALTTCVISGTVNNNDFIVWHAVAF